MTISQPIPQSVSNDLELSMKALQTLARISFIALSLIGASASVVASGYPDRPVKVVVGFPAGQSTDLRARMLAQGMATLLKQAVIVDNRPGAAGGTSHVAVKNAPPDGYTLVMGTAGTLAINPSLYDKLPYDPIKDFEPVALFAGSPMVLFTSIASPVNNYREFVAHVSARPPGTITYGSAGSAAHIAMEMLKKQAGLDLLRVPYKWLYPPIVAICITGVYSQANSIHDCWRLVVFGALGWGMKRYDWPIAPAVLGLVLGPMFETTLRQSMTMSHGSFSIFVTRPISAILVFGALLAVLTPVALHMISRTRTRALAP